MEKPINIAFVIDSLDRGGAERIVVSLANNLNPEEFRVHVITTRTAGRLAPELKSYVKFHSLDRSRRVDLNAYKRFAGIIDENDIRIVHSHNHTSSYFSRLAMLFAKRNWIHIMHDHHGRAEKEIWLTILDRLLLQNLDHYFGVSNSLVKFAVDRIGLSEEICEWMPNGVMMPNNFNRIPSDEFIIAQIGRLDPVKNHLMSIKAAAQLKALLPNFQWQFIGRISSNKKAYVNTCRKAIQRLGIEENITFMGEKENIYPFLQRAHVGILTSSFEGFPIVLLEYMAAGIPVIVTDVGECGGIVRKCGGGVVIEENNVNALVSALAEYAFSQEKVRADGEKNRECVRKHYSIKAMINRIVKVYNQLLS